MTPKQFIILIAVIKEAVVLYTKIRQLDPDLSNREIRVIEALRETFKNKMDAHIQGYAESEKKLYEKGTAVAARAIATKAQLNKKQSEEKK